MSQLILLCADVQGVTSLQVLFTHEGWRRVHLKYFLLKGCHVNFISVIMFCVAFIRLERNAHVARHTVVHSLMSSGARLDIVLDPDNLWGVRVGARPAGDSSFPVSAASAAENTPSASTFTPILTGDPQISRTNELQGQPSEDSGWSGWRPWQKRGSLIFCTLCVYTCAHLGQWGKSKTSVYICIFICGCTQTELQSLSFTRLSARLSHSSYYPQAGIQIPASLLLVNWKCEPRKQDGA